MQFIIKNCPACRDYDVFGRDNEGCCYREMKYCKDVDNCVMKQIVEKCKNAKIGYGGEPMLSTGEILSMLHIEECE